MCGIAGIIHRSGGGHVGQEMTSMLDALRHRGPDSAGFALYGNPAAHNDYVLRFKLAEQDDFKKSFSIQEEIRRRRSQVDERMKSMGVRIGDCIQSTDYAFRYSFSYDGDLRDLSAYLEDIQGLKFCPSAMLWS